MPYFQQMGEIRGGALAALACAIAAALALPLLPATSPFVSWYDVGGLVSILLAVAALVARRPPRRSGWVLVISGFGAWVIGDLVYAVEAYTGRDTLPAPSDAIYLVSYLVIAAGIVVMVRARQGGRDYTAWLDALIVTVGMGVLAAVFVIAPLSNDSELSLLAKVVYSTYPVADLLLITLLARLWYTPGARTSSFRLLLSALLVTLVADAIWSATTLITGDTSVVGLNNVLWLAGYALLAAAAWSPTMRALVDSAPQGLEAPVTRQRLVALTMGLMLPGLALLVDGAVDDEVLWPVIGLGVLVLSLLVLTRMVGLLNVVHLQASRLADLARSDALTGAPNRRTWDHELARACETSLETAEPLCVAMLDLDHFKAYNDSLGHQAGDLLLREAVTAWTERLGSQGMLARYGGEEFALLLPGTTVDEAARRVEELRRVTPGQQTFSAGVARWEPGTEPEHAVSRADQALYEAKRSGRDRVVVAAGDHVHDRA